MQPSPPADEMINVLDYWRILMRRRALIAAVVLLVAGLTAVYMWWLPDLYRSTTTLMPLGQRDQGLRAALGQLGGWLPPGLGEAESPTERILAVLNSRTVAEHVIAQLHLLPRLFASDWDAASGQWQSEIPRTLQDGVRALKQRSAIRADAKTGLISVSVEWTDPALAAAVANQYIRALQTSLNAKSFSLAKKNRVFVEAQLGHAQQELTRAEEALKRFEQQHGIMALEAQAAASINAIVDLRKQIMAKELQLRVLRRSVTGASREVALVKEAMQGLRAQLAQLENGEGLAKTPGAHGARAFLAFQHAPEIKRHYLRLQRDVRIQTELFTLLTQQLEQAKIKEAQDETTFQIVDPAIAADQKIKPRRGLNIVLAMAIGILLGGFLALMRDFHDDGIRSPEQVERQLGLPVVATMALAGFTAWQKDVGAEVDGAERGAARHLPEVEALRYAYTRLQRGHASAGGEVLLLTSEQEHRACATIALALAHVVAGMGKKVLIIDAHIRQPALHQLMSASLIPGLVDLSSDPEDWHKRIQTTWVTNLHVLPAGNVTSASAVALASPMLDALMAYSKQAYDAVICVAAPVLAYADAAMLSRHADATCLLLKRDGSSLDAVRQAASALKAVEANVAGVMLTYS